MPRPLSALGLCWGQAGFLPLGQALFFGLAAYLSGLTFIAFANVPIVAVLLMPLFAVVSGLLAYAIGLLVFRRPGESGAYFSMITLALSLLAFQIATSWNSVTGGFNGLKGIPGLPGLDDISDVYYVSAAVLLAAAGARRLALQRADRCAVAGAGAERAPPAAFRLRYQSAQVRRVRRERTLGRDRRCDLCAAARYRHAAARRIRPIGRSRDLGRGRGSREFARAGHRHAACRLAHFATPRHAAILGSVDGVVLHRHRAGISARHCRTARTIAAALRGAAVEQSGDHRAGRPLGETAGQTGSARRQRSRRRSHHSGSALASTSIRPEYSA